MPSFASFVAFVFLFGIECFADAVNVHAKLYHFPLFSSSRVVQLIAELQILDVEVVTLTYKQMKEEPYLSINPHGTVPAYEEDGMVLLESAAIVTYLCEKFDKYHHLLPMDLAERARYHQFAHYGPATLYPKAGGLYVHDWEFRPGTPGESKRSSHVIESSTKWLADHFVPFIERELGDGLYLIGDRLSAADIIMGWEVMLLAKVGFFRNFSKLQAYSDRLASEASFQLAYPSEIHDVCIWPHDSRECAGLHQDFSKDLRKRVNNVMSLASEL